MSHQFALTNPFGSTHPTNCNARLEKDFRESLKTYSVIKARMPDMNDPFTAEHLRWAKEMSDVVVCFNG
jgi:hypothetical protein